MIGWLLERLCQNVGATFTERDLLGVDAETFHEFAAAGLLRRLPLDYGRATVLHRGRVLTVVSGRADAEIEVIDEEEPESGAVLVDLEDVVRWQFDLAAWAMELGARLDAAGGPSQVAERVWWLGSRFERTSLFFVLPEPDSDLDSIIALTPDVAGVRSVTILPPHLNPGPPQRDRLITRITSDGFNLSAPLDDLLLAVPSEGYLEPVSGFRHSRDFRSVNRNGKIFSLTTQQARVVELLLDAYLNRSPDLSQAYILEELDVPGSALRFVFRGSDAWTDLVVSGGTNGTFRLEI